VTGIAVAKGTQIEEEAKSQSLAPQRVVNLSRPQAEVRGLDVAKLLPSLEATRSARGRVMPLAAGILRPAMRRVLEMLAGATFLRGMKS